MDLKLYGTYFLLLSAGWPHQTSQTRVDTLLSDYSSSLRLGISVEIVTTGPHLIEGSKLRNSYALTYSQTSIQDRITYALKAVLADEWIWAGAIYLVTFSAICLALLWLRPIWLLRINDALKLKVDIQLPNWLGGVKVPFRHALLVGFFNFHPRVLDAWVEKHIDTAREVFEEKPTPKDREVHVAVPVLCDGEMIMEFSPGQLRETSRKKRWCLLICGEGGAGKTSLACQVARWAMASDRVGRLYEHLSLPILIEESLDLQLDVKPFSSFMDAIREQLAALIRAERPIDVELLTHLLKRLRVLVVVDHFSETNEVTRKAIRPQHPDFPVNALIVTSRIEEKFSGLARTIIKPQRIQGNRLSSFMEAYLAQRGKRDLFDDAEYFDACRQLSLIVGARDITVLLAKLYAEQMIAIKEGLTGDRLPEDIPELMLNYLNELNYNVSENRLDDNLVHRGAKTVAWKCLSEMYRPAVAKTKQVLAALGAESESEVLLKYLENRLRLIQTVGAGRDRIRFSLDTLAEYLAGLYLVDRYVDDETAWRDFIHYADGLAGAPESIQGFLLAVRDCCLTARGIEARVPDFVAEELGTRAGLDPNVVAEIRFKQRVNLLISNLSSPAAEDREAAAKSLGDLGQATVPALIKALEDQNSFVRRSAALALGRIGPSARAAVPTLVRGCKDKEEIVRGAAAKALGEIGLPAESAISALMERLKDENTSVRNRAANSLSKMGAVAVPTLMEAINDDQALIRRYAVNTLGRIGPEAVRAVPALIEALKSDDALLGNYAAYALGKIGAAAVPGLTKAMKEIGPEVRGLAATAFEKMGKEARTALPALTQALKDSNPRVRRYAARALGGIGSEAQAAIPTLMKALRDDNGSVRGAAARALAQIGPAPLPMLRDALKDKDPLLRRVAVVALAQAGLEAIEPLRDGLADDNSLVRAAAAAGLLKMGPPAVSALVAVLKNDNQLARRSAAKALLRVDSIAIPELIKALMDEEPFVRRSAANALVKIGPAVFPELTKVLKDERRYVRSSAASIVRRIEVIESNTKRSRRR